MHLHGNRRTNTHQQILVDVAVVLQRTYGTDYARRFLEGMHIPELVIIRVLAEGRLRSPMHRDAGYLS